MKKSKNLATALALNKELIGTLYFFSLLAIAFAWANEVIYKTIHPIEYYLDTEWNGETPYPIGG
jgi:hypothetical protein